MTAAPEGTGGTVDGPRVLRARLLAQRLRQPDLPDVGGVVGHLVAVQAQEFQPALWGITRRVAPGARPDAAGARRAFDDGAFLRTHVLRPTWHVVRPDDARWLLKLSAPRVHQANAHPYRSFGVDERFDGATDALVEAVGSGPRTRRELAGDLAARGMEASGLQLGYLLMRAELDRALISGPMHGKQQTYAAFDTRVPAGYGPLGATFDADAALVELLRRYLAGRAYATVKDVVSWSGLTVRQVRDGLGLLGEEVAAVPGAGVLEGLTLWRAAASGPAVPAGNGGPDGDPPDGDPPNGDLPDGTPATGAPVVDLLQAYDELLMSYSESRHVVFGGVDVGEVPGASIHAIAVDGHLVGRWKWVLGGRAVAVEPQWRRETTAAERRAFDRVVGEVTAYWGR